MPDIHYFQHTFANGAKGVLQFDYDAIRKQAKRPIEQNKPKWHAIGWATHRRPDNPAEFEAWMVECHKTVAAEANCSLAWPFPTPEGTALWTFNGTTQPERTLISAGGVK